MSEDDKRYTSILLPMAKVALFTRDGDSKAAFLALKNDWRFARVDLSVVDGDVDTAIGQFQKAVSPDLVIVQTEKTDDAFLAKVESLGGTCAEGTSAVIIGPVNDVNLYRKILGMGVSDYLVKPIKTELLGDNIAATLIEKIGATGSRLIAVIGSKGGVGTSAMAQGLAWGIADELGQKTFLMDAAGGWSSMTVGMDFAPATTLAEAVRAATDGNEDSLSRMMHTAGQKLTVLSSGGDVMLEDVVTPAGFERLLEHLMRTYPVLVVDLSGAPAGLKRTALSRAHETIIITTPTLPALRATHTLLQEIKQFRGNAARGVDVLVNMVGLAPKHEVPKAQIESNLGLKAAAYVAFDPVLFISMESDAKKLTSDKTGAAIVEKMLALVKGIITSSGADGKSASNDGGDKDKKGGLWSSLSKLKSK